MKQLTLAAVGFERYARTTRRAEFLAEMERVVPWPALCALIEPSYPKPGNGRPPVGVERMLRIYFLQQWLQGSFYLTEVVFFHRHSHTALFADLIQNFPRDWFKGWRGAIARLGGIVAPNPS